MSYQAKKRHGKALDAYNEVHLLIRSQREKAEYCVIPTLFQSGRGKTLNTREIAMVAIGWRALGNDAKTHSIGFFRAVEVLCVTP